MTSRASATHTNADLFSTYSYQDGKEHKGQASFDSMQKKEHTSERFSPSALADFRKDTKFPKYIYEKVRGTDGARSAPVCTSKGKIAHVYSHTLSYGFSLLNRFSGCTGATAQIFQVKSRTSDTIYAGKVFFPEEVQWAQREAPTLREATTFPHTLRYIAFTKINGKTVIVTDLIPSRNLLHTSKNLSAKQFISIFRQSLEFLAPLHAKHKAHCDLKPENMIFKDRLVVIDLGMVQDFTTRKALQLLVQSRYYRAPEVFLGERQYNEDVDQWSLACIIYELFTTSVLFPSNGRKEDFLTFNQHLHLVANQIGYPSPEFLKKLAYAGHYYTIDHQGNIHFKHPMVLLRYQHWEYVLREAALAQGLSGTEVTHLIDLMKRMLRYQNRISAQDALLHPLFRSDARYSITLQNPSAMKHATLLIFQRTTGKEVAALPLNLHASALKCLHIPSSDEPYIFRVVDNAAKQVLFKDWPVAVEEGTKLNFNLSSSNSWQLEIVYPF